MHPKSAHWLWGDDLQMAPLTPEGYNFKGCKNEGILPPLTPQAEQLHFLHKTGSRMVKRFSIPAITSKL